MPGTEGRLWCRARRGGATASWPARCFAAGGLARIPRKLLVEANSTNHCTWRSQGRALVLESVEACRKFVALLRKYKETFGIEIYSYVLMGTHPHVVCRSTQGQEAFSEFWKRVNWGFARWYNRRTNGRGKVVMERMVSPRIQGGSHLLRVIRYGDLNPVKAKLVKSPKDWAFSSYAHYALGAPDDLITDAPEYLALGRTRAERRLAYRRLFARPLADELLTRRLDFVLVAFVGDEAWVATRLNAAGLSPPRRR